MLTPEPTLTDLENLARTAGNILREGYYSAFQIDYKGSINLVTEVDYRSETYLLEQIRTHYPQDHIVTEESGKHSGTNHRRWYIDPLDGTVNFAHRIPFFCVSIACEINGELELGVVYEPLRDECFTAQRGRGAWLNGQSIHTATTADLDHSLLTTGFSYDIRTNPAHAANLNHYRHFALHSQGVRRLGSAALDLCYVAASRFDGYWELAVESWDIAAGALIARESGAQVSAIDGSPLDVRLPKGIVCAPRPLHPQILHGLQHSADS